MPINENLITLEVLNNTLMREVWPQVNVVSEPKMGKVRTVYDIGDDQLIMISSDNLSTHDVVHRRQVYAKGENLDAISSYYFDRTRQIVPNHYIKTLAPNAWLVEKAEPILIEMVFRQYITGSLWRAYKKANGPSEGMTFCGIPIEHGYSKNEKLEKLIFTPTAKGQAKDFNIPEFSHLDPEEDDPKVTVDIIRNNYKAFGLRDPEDLNQLVSRALFLYQNIHSHLEDRGYLLADAKWEFGYLPDGSIGLIDECVTPDAARIWSVLDYKFDEEKNEFTIVQEDKQHFRDHIESLGLQNDKTSLANYWMPDGVIKEGVVKYCNIRETITGTLPEITTVPRKQVILEALDDIGILNG